MTLSCFGMYIQWEEQNILRFVADVRYWCRLWYQRFFVSSWWSLHRRLQRRVHIQRQWFLHRWQWCKRFVCCLNGRTKMVQSSMPCFWPRLIYEIARGNNEIIIVKCWTIFFSKEPEWYRILWIVLHILNSFFFFFFYVFVIVVITCIHYVIHTHTYTT